MISGKFRMKLLALASAICFFHAVLGAELRFLSVPSSVQLPTQSQLLRSQVPQVLRSLMGFTSNVGPEWSKSGKLLARPEAVAVISLPIKNSAGLPHPVMSYNLLVDDEANFSELGEDLKSSFPNKDYTFLDISNRIEGTHAEELSQLTPINSVSSSNKDLQAELENLKTVTTWLHTGNSGVQNGVPDVYIFRLPDAAPLSKKDRQTLATEITQLTKVLQNAYGDNCIISIVTSDPEVEKNRVKRQVEATPAPGPNPMQKEFNIYSFYNNTYPAAFNIVFFVSLVLALSILFIGAGMWYMDPGKDSIIYRMTMTRAKKD